MALEEVETLQDEDENMWLDTTALVLNPDQRRRGLKSLLFRHS